MMAFTEDLKFINRFQYFWIAQVRLHYNFYKQNLNLIYDIHGIFSLIELRGREYYKNCH